MLATKANAVVMVQVGCQFMPRFHDLITPTSPVQQLVSLSIATSFSLSHTNIYITATMHLKHAPIPTPQAAQYLLLGPSRSRGLMLIIEVYNPQHHRHIIWAHQPMTESTAKTTGGIPTSTLTHKTMALENVSEASGATPYPPTISPRLQLSP